MKKKRIILISDRLIAVFELVLKHFFPMISATDKQGGLSYIKHLNNIALSRGKRETLIYTKNVRLSFTRWLSKEPIQKEEIRLSLDKEGYPIILNEFKRGLLTRDKNYIQFVFTVLNITRGVVLSPNPSYKSIEDLWRGNLPNDWHTSRTVVLRTLGIGKKDCSWKKFHLSTKSGPNGQAIMTCMRDYLSLPPTLLNSIRGLGGEKLCTHLDKFDQVSESGFTVAHELDKVFVPDDGKRNYRRISTFGDMEGKTREIAVFDYWSQTVLKPIHDHLMKVLSRIPEDCTTDQTSFFKKLPKFGPYYSMDLTTATDRLPAVMQRDIISQIIGPEKAEHWYNIMVEYEFLCPDSKVRKYGTGQAMGAYSSWPAMAIQHHCIVWLASRRTFRSARGKYVLLGDDIVIADHEIAKAYREILSELDVPISKMKTHTSFDLYEFAKRWVYRGSEVTTFPTNAIMESWKRYYLLQNALEIASNRGYSLPDNGEGFISELYRSLGKFSQGERTYKLFRVFDILINKSIKTEERMSLLADAMDRFWPGNSFSLAFWEDSHESILNDIVRELSTDTWLSSQKQIEKIQTILENLKIEDSLVFDTLQESHPLSRFINQIQEERYQTNLAELTHENPLDYLKSLADTPFLTLKVFSMRSAQSRLLSQSRYVKCLIDFSTGQGEQNQIARKKLRVKRKKQAEKVARENRKKSKERLSPEVIEKREKFMEKLKGTVLYQARLAKSESSY